MNVPGPWLATALRWFVHTRPAVSHPHPPTHNPIDRAGEEVPITPEFTKRFEEVYREIAGQGERVLGFARKYLSLVRGGWLLIRGVCWIGDGRG